MNPETIETWVSASAELSAGMGSQPPCCPESSDLSWGSIPSWDGPSRDLVTLARSSEE